MTDVYKRKDNTIVLKSGKYKVFELFIRPGGFWCCFIFDKGKVVKGEGYHSCLFSDIAEAFIWGYKNAKRLNLLND